MARGDVADETVADAVALRPAAAIGALRTADGIRMAGTLARAGYLPL